MKTSNVFLIIITSIITFIGLAINKFYQKFIKANFVIKGVFHLFVTLLALRVMYWTVKPFIGGFLAIMKAFFTEYMPDIMSILFTPFVFLGVFIILSVLGVAIYCTESEKRGNDKF